MALNEKKKKEWEETLRELNLMDGDESIEEYTKGDYWTFTSQTRGQYFFTAKRVIFVGGLGLKSFAIKYQDIREIKKSMVGLFIPTGITVTAEDTDSGKRKKYKFSVMKRKNWIGLLSDRSGVSC